MISCTFYKAMLSIFPFSHPVCGEGNGTPLQDSCLENPMDGGAWWAAVQGVAKSRTRLSNFTFTFHFHALEKEMATHSSVLAWRIPGTGEPGGLPSMGSHRVGHGWSDLAAAAGGTTFSVPFYRWRDWMKLGTVHLLGCASYWRRLVSVGQIVCINTYYLSLFCRWRYSVRPREILIFFSDTCGKKDVFKKSMSWPNAWTSW